MIESIVLAAIGVAIFVCGWSFIRSAERTLDVFHDSLTRIEARLRALEQAQSPWAAPADEDDE